MNKIDFCEGGLTLADIATKNVGDNELNRRMKYITVKALQLIENSCIRGLTGYRIVCRNKSSI